jgi:DNA adenine methylase
MRVPFYPSTAMLSPMSYIGGKRRIAKRIVEMFPPHVTYCEVFLGGGQVFFQKEPSKVEVLNDIDGEVVNFFRCAQQHYQELCRYLTFVLVSRQWFEIFKNQNPSSLTDIQRAARFFYLQKNCYAGLVHDRHYSCKVIGKPGFNPGRLAQIFEKVHQRLARVQIESLPFQELIPRFDRTTTLFFCDPPYWRRKLYNHNFTDHDYQTLADQLQSIKGKFVLTVDDVPQLRELFKQSNITEIEIPYTAQREAGKRYRELIITNF